MKKFLLMACMALAIVTNAAAALYIGSKSELESFRNNVNNGNTYSGEWVYLTADIDLGGVSWTPIGNTTDDDGNGFQGTFDGRGYKISNFTSSITVEKKTDTYPMAGLFGLNKGTIKNLHVSNATVEAKATNMWRCNSSFAGVIAGCNRGTIKNCSVSGSSVKSSVDYKADGAYAHSGGIAGANKGDNAAIVNCYVNENVTIDASSKGTADAYENRISNKFKLNNSNTQTNCCTSTSTYNSSWRMGRVNAAVAYVNFREKADEPYYWDANGITPHVYYAFRVDDTNTRTASTYATVVDITYTYNGAKYNLYPAGHVINVTAYPQGVATDNADAGYKLAYNGLASIDAYVDNFANNSNGRYYRSQTARVTMPETYPADATVLSIVHTGLYGVSLENPAENVSNTLLADFDKSEAQVFNGAYFYNADTQIPVTVYPLGMNVNGEDDGYILSNADVLGAVRTDLTTVEGDRYVRQYKYNYVVSSGKNTIKYEVEESGFYRLTLADHGVDPAVRYEAAILTVPTVVISPEGVEYPMYRGGQEVTLEFSLNGWSEDEKNTGYFVKEVEGVDAQIIPADDTMGELQEGRYLRTEAYKFTMPAQATTVAYTTYNKSNEWAATNKENFISNSWGNPATAHQYINETTGIATNLVYYAFEGISDADAEGVTEAATISYEGEDAKTIQYNDNTYTLYPAGAKLTATFNLLGWSEDEKNTGWSVSEVYGSNDAVLSYNKISDTKSDDVNAETGRYDRAEVYEITVPDHKFDILYNTTNNSNEWAAINRATILYNNFGEGTEPESPYYIDETTGIATDYIYYMYEGITDTLAFIGSVRQGAPVEHSEYKLDFVKDETTYTLYPARYPSVKATFYLEGFTGDWSNVGYYIDEITNANSDTVEIVDAGLVEIYDDYETHNEFTNRFMRKFVYNITMPESPLALAYTTIMEQPTDVEDVTAEALQVYGVEGALVVKATAPAQLVVVTIDGRVAYSGMVEGNTRIALPAGMYIANNHKVIVR